MEDNMALGYTLGRDASNNHYGDGMFGGNGIWFLLILVLLWGGNRNGFGNYGGENLNGILTRGDLCQDMNFNNLDSAVRSLQSGLCDSTYALNNAIQSGNASIQQTLCQGFNGVNTAILTSSNQTQQTINQLGYNMQAGFCDVGRQIERTNYAIAQQTCDIVNNQTANTQRIIDFMVQEKMASKDAQIAQLTAQLSQNSQTATILNAINPPVNPAYIVPNPRVGYNYGNGCGCNNGYNF